MPRPKQRTPELRDRVTSVAVEVLARDGVAGFTTRRIAEQAHTSTPAVYELFGDKRGLVRELFFEGFRRLLIRLERSPPSADARTALLELLASYRGFMHENPGLAEVMFSRPFTDFEPTESELAAGTAVRTLIVERVRACVSSGVLHGDDLDIAHVLVALVQGLSLAESSSRLGRSEESVDRRWALAVESVLAGLAPHL